MHRASRPRLRRGFSLTELLVVVAIMTTMATLARPAFNTLVGANNITAAAGSMSGALEQARVQAMTSRSYVRVAFADFASSSGIPSTVVITMISSTGARQDNMDDATVWPFLSQPVLLDNLRVYDSLNGVTPDTKSDVTPSGLNAAGTPIGSFDRKIPASSTPLHFSSVVEFSPIGEARVCSDEPARYIKIACARPARGDAQTPDQANPFVLRLSANNGSITLLRKESM